MFKTKLLSYLFTIKLITDLAKGLVENNVRILASGGTLQDDQSSWFH